MSLIKAKKVPLSELFYDLVFVFAISKMTMLIHHLHHGVIELSTYLKFAVVLIVLINVWMYQTIYNNRFGNDTIKDKLFLFFDMFLLLFLSNAITDQWETTFKPFNITLGILTLSVFCQYLSQLTNKNLTSGNKTTIYSFMLVLGLTAVSLFISILFPYNIGIVIGVSTIIMIWFLPIFFLKKMVQSPVNFPHLVERISLLVIITFGEMIIAVAPYFQVDHFEISSIFIFIIVVSLFMYYITKFDSIIDHHITNSTGGGIAYLHFIIFLSLSTITVALSFLHQPEANLLFVTCFLYTGLILFYSFILAHKIYNKSTHQYSSRLILTQAALLLAGFIISLIFIHDYHVIIITTAIVTALISITLYQFDKKHQK